MGRNGRGLAAKSWVTGVSSASDGLWGLRSNPPGALQRDWLSEIRRFLGCCLHVIAPRPGGS